MVDDEERMCDECGKERAVVHLTEVVDGQPILKHLCQECYDAQGDLPQLAPSDVFSQLVQAVAPELKELSTRTCPRCGTNYLEFRQTMKLGCAHDYDVFSDALEQLLHRLHGSEEHVGKVPRLPRDAEAMDESERRNRVEILQRQMDKAVEEENYERAAELRDQIQEMEQHGTE